MSEHKQHFINTLKTARANVSSRYPRALIPCFFCLRNPRSGETFCGSLAGLVFRLRSHQLIKRVEMPSELGAMPTPGRATPLPPRTRNHQIASRSIETKATWPAQLTD